MGKETVSFSIDSRVMDKLRKQTNTGERSDIIEKFIADYVNCTFDSNNLDSEIEETRNKIEKKEEEIAELRDQISDLRKELQVLVRENDEAKKRERLKTNYQTFLENQVEKFERFDGDFSEFRNRYSSIYDLMENQVGYDVTVSEFWSDMEDKIKSEESII